MRSVAGTTVGLTAPSGGGVCEGDSGGPVADGSGAVVGMVTRSGQQGCLDASSTRTQVTAARADNLGTWITDRTSLLPVFYGRDTNSGKCLDVDANNNADGAIMQIWDCQGTWNQKWVWNPADSTIRNPNGRCMDDANHGTANGTTVWSWTCHGGANQKWVAHGDRMMRNPLTNRCLDVISAGTANGSRLQIWDCYGGANQKFDIMRADSEIRSRHPNQSERCLDSNVFNAGNGAEVQLYDCWGNWNQKFVANNADQTVRDLATGRCLDLEGPHGADGTKLLVGLRCRALEQRVVLDLEFGAAHEVVGELRGLIAEYLLGERIWALLVRAPWWAGRRAESLGAYHEPDRQLFAAAGSPGDWQVCVDRAMVAPSRSHDMHGEAETALLQGHARHNAAHHERGTCSALRGAAGLPGSRTQHSLALAVNAQAGRGHASGTSPGAVAEQVERHAPPGASQGSVRRACCVTVGGACRRCDRQFRELWRWRSHIRGLLRKHAPDSDSTEDAISEAFLVAWLHLEQVPQQPDEARAWLFRTARYCLANIRRRKTHQTMLAERLASHLPRSVEAPVVNGQVVVPAGGQVKVPGLRG